MPKVNIKGAIVSNSDARIYDWLGIEYTSPGSVSKIMDSAGGQDIEVEINSGGGSVTAGSEIYTALRKYTGKVTIDVVGMAGSAASVIAMAGRSRISPTGMLMIHNVSSGASGDYRDMEHQAEVLKVANASIANAYIDKTGMAQTELLSLMDNETWMSAEEAVKAGFIDEVMFKNEGQPSFYNSIAGSVIPQESIEKLRNMIKCPPASNESEADFLMARLQLLKLGGKTHE